MSGRHNKQANNKLATMGQRAHALSVVNMCASVQDIVNKSQGKLIQLRVHVTRGTQATNGYMENLQQSLDCENPQQVVDGPQSFNSFMRVCPEHIDSMDPFIVQLYCQYCAPCETPSGSPL